MLLSPRPRIRYIHPSPHGGVDLSELCALGVSPRDVLDFSVNINPYGPPLSIRKAIENLDISAYPDTRSTEFRRCVASQWGVSEENVLAGNGSAELIRVISLTYFGPEDKVLIPKPTFGEYEVSCLIAGARVVEQKLNEEKKFKLDGEETVGLARHHQVRGLFLCNPNNPTGQLLPSSDIEKVVKLLPDTLIILDQAYSSFTSDLNRHPDLIQGGNVILLRSLTKDFALGGLRLGYAISHPEVMHHLEKVLPPWNVNVVAQRAGIAALQEEEYVNQCSAKLKEAKEYLLSELTGLGLSPLPSEANYFLLKVGRAAEFRQKLLSRKILVRDCTSFGLPQYIRIGVRTLPECQRLISAAEEVLTEDMFP